MVTTKKSQDGMSGITLICLPGTGSELFAQLAQTDGSTVTVWLWMDVGSATASLALK